MSGRNLLVGALTRSPVTLVLALAVGACASTPRAIVSRDVPPRMTLKERDAFVEKVKAREPSADVTVSEDGLRVHVSNAVRVQVRKNFERDTQFNDTDFVFDRDGDGVVVAGVVVTVPVAEDDGSVGHLYARGLVAVCPATHEAAYRVPGDDGAEHLGFGTVQEADPDPSVRSDVGDKMYRLAFTDLPDRLLARWGCEPWPAFEAKLAALEKAGDAEGWLALRRTAVIGRSWVEPGSLSALDATEARFTPIAEKLAADRKAAAAGAATLQATADEEDSERRAAAAWSEGLLRKMLPLYLERSERARKRGQATDADLARAKALVELLGKESDRALKEGRLATSAAYTILQFRISQPLPWQKLSERLLMKPGTPFERGLSSAAQLAVKLMPLVTGEGPLAALVESGYGRGDLTDGLPLVRSFGLSPSTLSSDLSHVPGLARAKVRIAAPATSAYKFTVTGEVREGGVHDVTGPNPAYAAWLDRLDALNAQIARLGGQIDSASAAAKRQSFVTTYTAQEGSFVKSDTRETDASLSSRQAAAAGKLVGRMELRSAESDLEEHLAREPSPTRSGQTSERWVVKFQNWTGLAHRTLVLSGLGPDVRVEQTATPFRSQRERIEPDSGGPEKDDWTTEEAMLAHAEDEMNKRVAYDLRGALQTYMGARYDELAKAIPAADRAEDLAYANVILALGRETAPLPVDIHAIRGPAGEDPWSR